jgi:hypothetical protein
LLRLGSEVDGTHHLFVQAGNQAVVHHMALRRGNARIQRGLHGCNIAAKQQKKFSRAAGTCKNELYFSRFAHSISRFNTASDG